MNVRAMPSGGDTVRLVEQKVDDESESRCRWQRPNESDPGMFKCTTVTVKCIDSSWIIKDKFLTALAFSHSRDDIMKQIVM